MTYPPLNEQSNAVDIRRLEQDPSFGAWFFAKRKKSFYDLQASSDIITDLFWFLDVEGDPYSFSIAEMQEELGIEDPRFVYEQDDSNYDEKGTLLPPSAEDLEPTYNGYSADEVWSLNEFLETQRELFLRSRLGVKGLGGLPYKILQLDLSKSPDAVEPPSSAGVYFVKAHDRVKIGTSRNIKKRMLGLQTNSPFKLELLLVLSGGVTEERKLHEQFRALHVTGEWFLFQGNLEIFVREMQLTTYAKA